MGLATNDGASPSKPSRPAPPRARPTPSWPAPTWNWPRPTWRRRPAALITAGARAVHVVPLFLGMGKHAREDLPHQLEALRHKWPNVDISLARIVGEEPELVDLLAKIAIKS
jgi:sirohydrochlorin ferrochelatase